MDYYAPKKKHESLSFTAIWVELEDINTKWSKSGTKDEYHALTYNGEAKKLISWK